MKIAYLILAHQHPDHFGRLIKALAADSTACFVHVDKKVDRGLFKIDHLDNVHFSPQRIRVYWGNYSIMKAGLQLLREAMNAPVTYDRFVLISGADYPLRSNAYIKNFFISHPKEEFVHLVELPNPGGWNPIKRFRRYTPAVIDLSVVRAVRKIMKKVGLFTEIRDYKKGLKGLTPCGADGWWGLSREAGEYLLNFIQQNPGIVNFLKNVEHAHETFVQTILGNSPFRPQIVGNLTYTDWRAGGWHPALISEEHLKLFRSNAFLKKGEPGKSFEFLFARKFSDDLGHIVDTIDELRNQQDG